MVVYDSKPGDDTGQWEVDMPDRIPGIAEYVAGAQVNLLALGQKPIALPARKAVDQAVAYGCESLCRHSFYWIYHALLERCCPFPYSNITDHIGSVCSLAYTARIFHQDREALGNSRVRSRSVWRVKRSRSYVSSARPSERGRETARAAIDRRGNKV